MILPEFFQVMDWLVLSSTDTSFESYQWSSDNQHLAVKVTVLSSVPIYEIYLFDIKGNNLGLIAYGGDYPEYAWSPDGKTLALLGKKYNINSFRESGKWSDQSPSTQVYLYKLKEWEIGQIIHNHLDETNLAWDGNDHLTFTAGGMTYGVDLAGNNLKTHTKIQQKTTFESPDASVYLTGNRFEMRRSQDDTVIFETDVRNVRHISLTLFNKELHRFLEITLVEFVIFIGLIFFVVFVKPTILRNSSASCL